MLSARRHANNSIISIETTEKNELKISRMFSIHISLSAHSIYCTWIVFQRKSKREEKLEKFSKATCHKQNMIHPLRMLHLDFSNRMGGGQNGYWIYIYIRSRVLCLKQLETIDVRHKLEIKNSTSEIEFVGGKKLAHTNCLFCFVLLVLFGHGNVACVHWRSRSLNYTVNWDWRSFAGYAVNNKYRMFNSHFACYRRSIFHPFCHTTNWWTEQQASVQQLLLLYCVCVFASRAVYVLLY